VLDDIIILLNHPNITKIIKIDIRFDLIQVDLIQVYLTQINVPEVPNFNYILLILGTLRFFYLFFCSIILVIIGALEPKDILTVVFIYYTYGIPFH
jgi:hypothetical protein